jgi:hypothetical protein
VEVLALSGGAPGQIGGQQYCLDRQNPILVFRPSRFRPPQRLARHGMSLFPRLLGLMIFMALSAAPAEARYLYLSCTTQAMELPGETPDTLVVAIDLDQRVNADVGGEVWIMDSSSERYFAAHFNQAFGTDTLRIDRITGEVELVFQMAAHTTHNRGFCHEIQPKF